MHQRVVLALLVSSTTSAFARPAVTPTVVIQPNVAAAQVAPWIYRKGNLRLSIACAEAQAIPEEGLALSVDGVPQLARRVNGRWSAYTDVDGNESTAWNASDTG